MSRSVSLESTVRWSEDSIDNLAMLQAFQEELGPYVVQYVIRPALKAAGNVILRQAKKNLRQVTRQRHRWAYRLSKKNPLLMDVIRKRQKGRLERALISVAYVSEKRSVAVGSVGVRRGTRIRHAHLLEFGTTGRKREFPKVVFAKYPHAKGYTGRVTKRPFLGPALETKRAEAEQAIKVNVNKRLTPANLKRYKASALRLAAHRARREMLRVRRAAA